MNHYKQGTNIQMFWKINCMSPSLESTPKNRLVGPSKHETIIFFDKEWHPKDSVMDYWCREGLEHHKKCALIAQQESFKHDKCGSSNRFNKTTNTTGGMFIQDSRPQV